MGSHSLTVLFIVLTASQVVFGEVWEFGRYNAPGSIKIFEEDGRIGLFEHEKKIKLPVPQCYAVTYVRVEVNNLIATPTVQYDRDTRVVAISYSPLSSSLSSFTIVVKARRVWIPGCELVSERLTNMKNDQVVDQ